MAKVAVSFNSKCLKDGKIEEQMVKVGPMIFCLSCFGEEFKLFPQNGEKDLYSEEKGEVPTDSKTYQYWLENIKIITPNRRY